MTNELSNEGGDNVGPESLITFLSVVKRVIGRPCQQDKDGYQVMHYKNYMYGELKTYLYC